MPLDPDRQLPDDPRTANALWFDAQIRHQIGILRVAGGIRRKVFALLDATEGDLRRQIVDRLSRARAAGLDSPAAVRRLQLLLDEITAIRGTAWRQVQEVWLAEVAAIAEAEPQFQTNLLQTILPVQLDVTLPTVNRMRALAATKVFQGRTMREWARSIRATDLRRIEDQIKIGLVQGEAPTQIARRVVGTASRRGADGVTQITRRNAEAITRTAAVDISTAASREWIADNADIVDTELYVATLDGVTTPICRALDGERFPVGEGPHPTLHFSCRSKRVALLDPEPLGDRPMKPVTERRLLREFAEQEGFDAPTTRGRLPYGTKGQFDQFARRRTRELIGTVPAKTTYSTFLKRQPAAFQDDIIGATRGALFRRGGLTLDKFVDLNTGKEFNLNTLAKMHADAFRAANLDPAAFL